MKLFSILFLASFFHFAHACVVTDDLGKTLTLKKPVERIISLAPDITELLFASGAGSRVIGVVTGSDYPPAAKKILSVGNYSGIDLEAIVALKPDLIVTWQDAFSRQRNVLEQLGIPIYTTHPQNLLDVPRTLRNIGCLVGKTMTANVTAKRLEQQLARLQAQYHHRQPLRVFYQMGSYSLMTINKKSWINQAIELCGGINVFAEARFLTPVVSWEAILQADPEVILSSQANDHWQQKWLAWPRISAVKGGLWFSIPPDLLERAGPRLVEGVQFICTSLAKARCVHSRVCEE